MSYTSTGGLPTIPRLAVAGVDEGAPETVVTSGSPASLTSLTLPSQASAPAVPASGVVLYANSSGRLSWRSASDTFSRSIIVTATGNRTFTAPDADFTFAGQNLTNTFTLANTFSANGALSAPAVSFTGTPITGGTATTTKPMVLVETSGATSTGWDTGGAYLGINQSSGFSGYALDIQKNGSRVFSVFNSGTTAVSGDLRLGSASAVQWNLDAIITRKTTANLQLGAADAAAPVAQTLSVQSVVAGTTDTAGVNWTFNGSRGTGTGSGGSVAFQVAPSGSTGSSQNTLVTALVMYGRNTSTAVSFSGYSNSYEYYNFAGTSPLTAVNSSTAIGQAAYSRQGTETTSDYGFAFVGNNRSNTAGTHTDVVVQRGFSPTSGTALYVGLAVQPTINQTGGANGITRGLYINPTLTAAADFRSLDIAAGKVVIATNGALSEPAFSLTGTPITGGTATTTKPMVLIETSGATSTGWNTNGTMFGVNATSGYVGLLTDVQSNGSSRFIVTTGGTVRLAAAGQFEFNTRGILTSPASGQIQLGSADAASAVAQTLSVQSVVAGTSNTAGADWTQRGSLGTGTGASGNIVFQLGTPAASGTTQHTASTGLTLSNVGTSGTAAHRATFAGTVATAGYTVATLPAAGTAGRRAYVTDATAPTYLGALVGGGAVVCPVFDNGSAWVSA